MTPKVAGEVARIIASLKAGSGILSERLDDIREQQLAEEARRSKVLAGLDTLQGDAKALAEEITKSPLDR
jgi:hypothetical protein